MISNETYKTAVQEMLYKKCFQYRVDVEPLPSATIEREQMSQVLRKVSFDLNKKYLRNRAFPKLPLEQRFYFFINPQDRNNLHYHCLLHVPLKTYNNRYEIKPFSDVHFPLRKQLRVNALSRRSRKILYNKKVMRNHMPFESTEATSAIRVERVKNLEASINYNTRQMYVMNDSDFLVA